MPKKITGRLMAVSEAKAGDEILVDMLSGSQTIYLTDVSDFDENGGTCSIDGTQYDYDAVDPDGNSIHLTTGLTTNESAETRVNVWDVDSDSPVVTKSALVMIPGQEDGDAIEADVDHSLVPLLAPTIQARGQSVTLTKDGDGFRVIAVNGKDNSARLAGSGSLWQAGYDMGDGTVVGLEAVSAAFGAPTLALRSRNNGGAGVVNVTDETGAFMPIKASGFPTPSDQALKTTPTDPPDALAIIASAPAQSWRYLTDAPGVERIGPIANDLPSWLAQEYGDDGHLSVDLARMVGVLWRAVEQLAEELAALKGSAD